MSAWIDFVLVVFSTSAVLVGLLAHHAPVDTDDAYEEVDAGHLGGTAGAETTDTPRRKSA